MRKILLACAALLCAAPALAGPATVKKVIDNDQVTAWDITLKPGDTGPSTPADMDAVILFVEGGTIKSDSVIGTTTQLRAFGDSIFVPQGQKQHDTLIKGGPAHEVMIGLKNVPAKSVPNLTSYPAAWPRPGAVKTMDNIRVNAWYYEWLPGRPAPTHFHVHQQVSAYRYDGSIKTTTPDGHVTIDQHHAGEITFTEPNRTHSEEWNSGKMAAVLIELK